MNSELLPAERAHLDQAMREHNQARGSTLQFDQLSSEERLAVLDRAEALTRLARERRQRVEQMKRPRRDFYWARLKSWVQDHLLSGVRE